MKIETQNNTKFCWTSKKRTLAAQSFSSGELGRTMCGGMCFHTTLWNFLRWLRCINIVAYTRNNEITHWFLFIGQLYLNNCCRYSQDKCGRNRASLVKFDIHYHFLLCSFCFVCERKHVYLLEFNHWFFIIDMCNISKNQNKHLTTIILSFKIISGKGTNIISHKWKLPPFWYFVLHKVSKPN